MSLGSAEMGERRALITHFGESVVGHGLRWV